jgi:hypothetical protein
VPLPRHFILFYLFLLMSRYSYWQCPKEKFPYSFYISKPTA